jgi:DNA repair protein RAD16
MAYSNSSTEGPIKAIVFSQWTSMLDLVEISLNQYCIQYRRLDGTLTLSSRDRAVKDLNTDPKVWPLPHEFSKQSEFLKVSFHSFSLKNMLLIKTST